MKRIELSATDSRRLGTLFDLEHTDPQRIWRPDELAAVMRHQLSAPVRVDLAEFDRGLAAKVENLAAAQGLLLSSFDDLLKHQNPPVELLIAVKSFAKACRRSPDSRIPHPVASVLYYACIAAAMLRCDRRITTLTDAELHKGIEWALAQTWIDKGVQDLLSAVVSENER